jgi:raffinose/stachyose/melibiose transport system permease protein
VPRLAFYAGLSLLALIWIAPVFILVFTALKSASDFAHGGTFSLPERIEWGNFARAWDVGIRTYFANSAVMTVVKVPAGILVAALAAFALRSCACRAGASCSCSSSSASSCRYR